MTSNKSIISVSQVADALSVSRSTIYRYIKDGRLHATKGASGRYLIQVNHVVRFVEAERSSRNKNAIADSSRDEPDVRMGQAESMSRRRFLLSGLAVAIGGGFGGSFFYDVYRDRVLARRNEDEQRAQNDNLLTKVFGGLDELSWSAGLDHMRETYDLTDYHESSAFRASVDLGAALGVSVLDWFKDATGTEGFPGRVAGDTDLVTTGSPISDPVTALIMEYFGRDRYHLNRPRNPLVELPVEFHIDEDRLPIGSKMAKRFVAGEVREMPNWQVALNGVLLPPPKLGKDNWIQSDYLTVSRLPNMLDPTAFMRGTEAIVVAGTHGIGTEAIGLLLNNSEKLSRIAETREQHGYFQALIEVSDIDHGPNGDILRSTPVGLGGVRIEPIELDLERVVWRWLRSTTD